ncbi:MAG: heavy metal translocating P-type ATPase [Candidatus Eisenbacteria bacterium]|nr:heavy metal translocating P-type ATPase [Candidatus Eisenbacteria bacterium]
MTPDALTSAPAGARARLARLWSRRSTIIAVLAVVAIVAHLAMRYGMRWEPRIAAIPLFVALAVGGAPQVYGLIRNLLRREFGSDLLGGISIVTSVVLGEYLAGTIIVLMLAGGEALERGAMGRASSALAALAKRMPAVAHRKRGDVTEDVPLADLAVGDTVVLHPHEICPADGTVSEGRGVMDESYLTGEPFRATKTRGSAVMSGAVNGDAVLTVVATRIAADSRHARIMEVMRESEATRPQLRRLADQLGAAFTPVALAVAVAAWALTGESSRFLAVIVIATPCPLLLAIPIAIIGSVSRCAKRAIIVRNPVALERVTGCRTAIFDKTGTLTYGDARLSDTWLALGFGEDEVLELVASVERYSRHPLARAILAEAASRKLTLREATEVNEAPGEGLRGAVAGRTLRVTSRARLVALHLPGVEALPPPSAGLECAVALDERCVALLRFRDEPRAESVAFLGHLGPRHGYSRAMIVSGDRDAETRDLAARVGITEVFSEQSPEQKLALVRAETARAPTLYVGDGINDAPAMLAATVGMSIGQGSDVTSEAASVVIMDSSLQKVDEFIHIGRRMRAIALQSALGGMALSLVGMVFAATGHLSAVGGAIAQEAIDVLAVLNALRAAFPAHVTHDS